MSYELLSLGLRGPWQFRAMRAQKHKVGLLFEKSLVPRDEISQSYRVVGLSTQLLRFPDHTHQ